MAPPSRVAVAAVAMPPVPVSSPLPPAPEAAWATPVASLAASVATLAAPEPSSAMRTVASGTSMLAASMGAARPVGLPSLWVYHAFALPAP